MPIERTGEGKFFGFGICQKLKVNLIDIEREITLTKEHTIDASFAVDGNCVYPFPRFYVQNVERDEMNNMLTVSAYDILYKAEEYKATDLGLVLPYTLRAVAAACATTLDVPIKFINVDETTFSTYFEEGANLDGSESVRYILNAIAEATQTIYYINNQWELVFRRLDKDAALALTVGKAQYWELQSGENRKITNITHTTELGDNTSTVGDNTGVTQFVRENPFWELRDDIAELLNQAQANIAGLEINQFEADWSGNYLLEIGDRFGFVGENDETVATFLLDDTLTFDGTLTEHSKWEYDENEGETESNPVSLGDALNQTYARVDKANQKITMLVEKTDSQESRISKLELDTDGITATVSSIQTTTNDSIDALNGSLQTLTKTVEAKMTSEQVSLAIKQELENGVETVTTSTGYTFDADGLTVSKSGSEMTTQITEDGMTVYRDNDAVLVANNEGVNAENLHATTYLIIGGRSRFENYESDRTGCFWIGGTD